MTFRSWCEACVAGRATEDSRNRSATEPSVTLVAMGYGFLGRDTDVDLATILVLIQRPHSAVGACQVLRNSPKPYPINYVLAFLDTWGLREMLLKADNEPAVQAIVDAVRVKRVRGRWWRRVRSTRISQMVRSRILREGSRASRGPTCVCCKRSTVTRLTARALFCRGLSGTRRTCSVDLCNVTIVTVRGPTERQGV